MIMPRESFRRPHKDLHPLVLNEPGIGIRKIIKGLIDNQNFNLKTMARLAAIFKQKVIFPSK
jgi:hypothetical protein